MNGLQIQKVHGRAKTHQDETRQGHGWQTEPKSLFGKKGLIRMIPGLEWNPMNANGKITLKRIREDEADRWDKLVDSSPHGTVFHTWDFVSTMAEHARMRILGGDIKPTFHPLIVEHDGRDIGLIPLYEFRGGLIRYVFSPPPHTAVTYLGPVLNFPEGLRQSTWEKTHRMFHDAVEEYLKRLRPQAIRIRTPPGYTDMRQFLWRGYHVSPLYNYVLDLARGVDALSEGLGSDNRKTLSRTERAGYEVSEGSLSDVERLFRHQESRYLEQGLDMNITLEYVKDLWGRCGNVKLKVFVIRRGGEYVSATLEATYKGKMSGWVGLPRSNSKAGDPNFLLMWDVIKWGASNGFREYETIWANQERMNEFKTKVNPKPSTYYSALKMSAAFKLTRSLKSALMEKKWDRYV